jgi:cell wall-associated NlpC family hydrolase
VIERSLARQAEFAGRATHRVRANQTQAFAGASARSLPVSDLVVGTPVVAEPGAARGWTHVELPDGRQGFVRKTDLETLPRGRRMSRERLISTGLRFIGIPYLWGGNTPKGFDCSGLVQRIFRLNGMILPRDSDQQARFGRHRAVAGPRDLVPGDLVFFGRNEGTITHVGLVLPDGKFLHAYGQVRINSLDPTDESYDPGLASIWRLTRDPLGR